MITQEDIKEIKEAGNVEINIIILPAEKEPDTPINVNGVTTKNVTPDFINDPAEKEDEPIITPEPLNNGEFKCKPVLEGIQGRFVDEEGRD